MDFLPPTDPSLVFARDSDSPQRRLSSRLEPSSPGVLYLPLRPLVLSDLSKNSHSFGRGEVT